MKLHDRLIFTPIRRFSLVCIIFLTTFGLLFGWLVTKSIESNMLSRSRQLTAEFIHQIVTHDFTPEELSTPRIGDQYEAFSLKVSQHVLGTGIVRAKVWNRSRQVIWSDDRRLIGQRFLENHELEEALNGEITSEFSHLEKKENDLERHHAKLLELYIPVRFPGNPDVLAVVEVYQKLDQLYADVHREKQIVWLIIVIGFSLLYGLLYKVFVSATKRIERQNEERKIMEAHLVQAERQQMVSTIAASIGHELNNALTGLIGYMEVVKRSPQNEVMYAKFLTLLSEQFGRLETYGRELLTIGKPQQPSFAPVLISDLLDEILSRLAGSGLLKYQTITKNFSENLPLIHGDKGLLEQVFTNLVINAAHAMERGGDLTCSIQVSKLEGFIEIIIKDSGHGIPYEIRNKIFEPFFTTKEPGKGTGLGMYIVQQIVEQHGGTICVESEVGRGTSMIVELPVLKK